MTGPDLFRGAGSRAIPIREHAAAALRRAIDAARGGDLEALHATREGELVGRLDDEVNGVASHLDVENSKVAALVGEREGARDGRIDRGGLVPADGDLATSVDLESQAIDEPGDDMDRVADRDRWARSMRLARGMPRS
jgi:hypothetical protein